MLYDFQANLVGHTQEELLLQVFPQTAHARLILLQEKSQRSLLSLARHHLKGHIYIIFTKSTEMLKAAVK